MVTCNTSNPFQSLKTRRRWKRAYFPDSSFHHALKILSLDSYLDSPNLTESAETNLLSSPIRSLSFFVINKIRFHYSKLCSFQGNACSSLAWSRARWTRTTTASWSGWASASPTSLSAPPGRARSWPGRRLKKVSQSPHRHHHRRHPHCFPPSSLLLNQKPFNPGSKRPLTEAAF